MLTPILTDLMLIVSVGIFLDLVLIGKEEREKISQYLVNQSDPGTLTDRYFRFLTLSHTLVFGRFFSSRIASRTFFTSAASVSLTSFILVASAQVYFSPERIADIRVDLLQVMIIIVFIAFNIAFDYFTIIQTKIFIEASIDARSIGRSLIFIVSDFLVTLNTFILAYAFFVMLVVQFFVWPSDSIRFIREKKPAESVQVESTPPGYLIELGASTVVQRLKYSADFEGLLVSGENASEQRPVTVYYHSTLDPRKVDLQLLILSEASRFTVNVDDDFGEVNEDEKDALARALVERSSSLRGFRDQEPDQPESLPEIEQAYLVASGRIRSVNEVNAAYTMTFNQTDVLEDAFPVSIATDLALFPLDRFVSDTMSNESVPSPVAICFFSDGSRSRFLLTSQNVEFLARCNDFLTVEFVWHWRLARDFSVLGRDLDGRVVPYNTLLITSLLPTLALYVIISLMAVVTFIYSKLLSRTQKFGKYFLRAPFAITCFVLALPMIFFGIV